MKIETEKYTIYNADCFEILPKIAKPDVIITDIPYDKATACSWDLFNTESFSELLNMSKGVITFANFKIASRLYTAFEKYFRYELIWQKTNGVGFFNANSRPLRKHEYILIFGNPDYTPQKYNVGIPYSKKCKANHSKVYHGNSVYESKSDGERHPGSVLCFKQDHDMTISTHERDRHPTQKPLAAFEWLVSSYSKPGETVLDPFMGSGTAGVAAMNTGRRFIGIEKEQPYFELAKKRIEKALCKGKIFKDLPN